METPCIDLVSLTKSIIDMNIGASVPLTIQLCTRVAFLVSLYILIWFRTLLLIFYQRWATARAPENDKEYWKHVNTELSKMSDKTYLWQKQ